MKKTLKIIWDSKQRNLIIYLSLITLFGIYLYFERPGIKSKKNLIEITGTLNHIDRVLVYYGKIIKSARDSTLYFHLQEYPCKFQVSYFPYDKDKVFKTTKFGDKITFYINKEDIEKLSIRNKRIRSFSLKVNNQTYVTVDNGLSGFGKGYFDLALIIISIVINVIVIWNVTKRKNKKRPTKAIRHTAVY